MCNAPKSYDFSEGDNVLIFDRKERRYLQELQVGFSFHTHLGTINHDDLIGIVEGSEILSDKGHQLRVFKPTLSNFILEMPRIATVSYPKDMGAILLAADIFPGAKVVEAGTGSGALTSLLCRAVGQYGKVISYDIRQDMLDVARKNLSQFNGNIENLTLYCGDVADAFDIQDVDRVILDLPEPWNTVDQITEGLVPGGIMLSFLPTVL